MEAKAAVRSQEQQPTGDPIAISSVDYGDSNHQLAMAMATPRRRPAPLGGASAGYFQVLKHGKDKANSPAVVVPVHLPSHLINRILDELWRSTVVGPFFHWRYVQHETPHALVNGPYCQQRALTFLALRWRAQSAPLRLVCSQWKLVVERREEWIRIIEFVFHDRLDAECIHPSVSPFELAQEGLRKICALCQINEPVHVTFRTDREPEDPEETILLDGIGPSLVCHRHLDLHEEMRASIEQRMRASLGMPALGEHRLELVQERSRGATADSDESELSDVSNFEEDDIGISAAHWLGSTEVASHTVSADFIRQEAEMAFLDEIEGEEVQQEEDEEGEEESSCECSICMRGKRKRDADEEEERHKQRLAREETNKLGIRAMAHRKEMEEIERRTLLEQRARRHPPSAEMPTVREPNLELLEQRTTDSLPFTPDILSALEEVTRDSSKRRRTGSEE